MTISYQTIVNDPTNAGGSADAILQADMNAALSVYSQYLTGKGTLVVQLDIDNTTTGRESGGPTSSAPDGTSASGLSLFESSAAYELATGQHVAGTTSDITVTVDPGYMKELSLAAALSPSASVAGNLYNPVQVFLHELMHGFGMSGWYSQTGTLPGNYESPFDSMLVKNADGTVSFTGANVEAVYGGPVPITSGSTAGENYYHFGNALSDLYQSPTTVSSPLTLDLMNGIVFFYDYDYGVSSLDLAMLKDLGYDVTGTLGAPTVTQPAPIEYLAKGFSTLTLPAATFTDPNAQQLTYSATLAGGGTLPSWLQFNSQTDSFSVVASTTGSGAVPVTVTATDRGGLSASETFDLVYGGLVSAAQAVAGSAGTTGITVGDSAADVAQSLDALQSLAATKSLQSITLLDGGAPTLSVTPTQLSADQGAIKDISGLFTLTVAAPAASTTISGAQGEAIIVSFSGNGSQYSITPTGDGTSFTISGDGITDRVGTVQALAFSDHTDFVASLTPATAGGVSSAQVADLYSAVFARTPDVVGLAYYENMAAANPGLSILNYAQSFLASPEYTGNSAHNYAQTPAGDAQFITDTYNNLLHRAPASGDVAWYQANVINPHLAGLTAGTAAYTQAESQAHAALLADFSASAEFLGDVQVTAQTPTSAQHWLVLI